MVLLCIYVTVTLLLLFSPVWLLWDPMDCSPPGSSVHRIFQARIWSGPFPSSGGLADPEIEPAFLALQVVSLPLSHLGDIYRNIGISQIGDKFKVALSSLILIQDNFFPFQHHPPSGHISHLLFLGVKSFQTVIWDTASQLSWITEESGEERIGWTV